MKVAQLSLFSVLLFAYFINNVYISTANIFFSFDISYVIFMSFATRTYLLQNHYPLFGNMKEDSVSLQGERKIIPSYAKRIQETLYGD